jgi:HlyD family secretion protein
MRAVRRGLLGVVLLGAAVGIVLALRPRPVPVDVAPAARGALIVAIEETGITRVKDRYVVSAPVSGTMSRQLLEPGDQVAEGQTVAELAPLPAPLLDARTRSEAQAKLSAAVSALGQAEALQGRAAAAEALGRDELARARSLAAGGSVPAQQLERAEFESRMRAEELSSAAFGVKVASEQVRVARAALAAEGALRGRHVDVLAPASGRVLRVLQRSQGVVQAGAALLEVGSPEALELVIDLLSTDAVRVAPGTPVTIQGWGGDRALAARVRRVEPSAFTKLSALGVEEQRVNIVAAFTDGREHWAVLGDGFRIEARLVLWRGDDVLKVPHGAVFRRGDGWAVFRVASGRARLTPVQVGHRGDAEVEVLSGLDPGVAVVVHPGDRVKDGVRVEAFDEVRPTTGAPARSVEASATPRGLDRGDVDLLHRHHRLEGASRFLTPCHERFGQDPGRDLPGHPPPVLAPAARALLATLADDRVPVAIGLLLVLGRDLERERLAVLELGSTVQAHALHAGHRELDRQHVALLAAGIVAGRADDAPHRAIREGPGVEAGRGLGVLVEPEKDRVLRHVLVLRFVAVSGVRPCRPSTRGQPTRVRRPSYRRETAHS